MRRFILDTSVLISHWKKCAGKSIQDKKPADAEKWARALIQTEETDAILTPVYIEMIAGTRNQQESRLTTSFLGQFTILDRGDILREDWQVARRLAERIPRDSG